MGGFPPTFGAVAPFERHVPLEVPAEQALRSDVLLLPWAYSFLFLYLRHISAFNLYHTYIYLSIFTDHKIIILKNESPKCICIRDLKNVTVHNGKNQKRITAPISKTIPVAITGGFNIRSTRSALQQILRLIVFINSLLKSYVSMTYCFYTPIP